MPELQAFRMQTREWLEQNCPQSMRTPMTSENDTVWGGRNATFPSDDAKLWLERMGAKGWTTPTWPTQYGGGGLNHEQALILQDELRRINARAPIQSFGIDMLGPALLEYGSEELKREHAPKIIRGEIRWCQGYSEPSAGSDLASLRTKCEDKGDHWLVNGQKIWTSYANKADMIFCLVRTGPLQPKHDGISVLLIDMASEGVSTKPIQLISGASPFCETFFDNVKVPKDNIVGEVNEGWTIAKRILQFERNMISGMGGQSSGPRIDELAKQYAETVVDGNVTRLADPILRHKIADFNMRLEAFGMTLRRAGQEGGGASNLSSMFKLEGTELNKERYELIIEVMGTQAIGWEGNGFSDSELRTTRAWLRSKANSIEGGTSEVQKNIIAKRVLNLPS